MSLRRVHRLAVVLPAGSAALDVGEEEGDGASRQIGYSCCPPSVLACAGVLYYGA